MRESRTGKFIVIEGIDGSGKTTISRLLLEALKKCGFDTVLTKEPTGRKYGRELMERIKSEDITPKEELELFIKDRKDHVEYFLFPNLQEGRTIICDRYYLSNCAYQGAKGISPVRICEMNEKFPIPDLVLFLYLDPELSLSRKKRLLPHFENRNFLKKVNKIYIEILTEFRYVRIDASQPLEEVFLESKRNVLSILNERETERHCP